MLVRQTLDVGVVCEHCASDRLKSVSHCVKGGVALAWLHTIGQRCPMMDGVVCVCIQII